ncbi:helix-turn-helix domain-containing protein [Reyranella sp. CPCC 100927]|uniref:DinB family protein n=1 Tax=Reyranella sp. CPCC 100927 TaxID=2599616 RepID=UPI0015B49457|nr:helix-turn-helix domain-containing protein [Reyranella sp. CPCC 100927]
MDTEKSVTVLRDRDGAPQHAVLDWNHYQALLRQAPAHDRGDQVSPEVTRRVADGVSPLRAWREARGFSQAQLALLTGISRAYLTQIETGERAGTIEVMAHLARNLGCRIEDLVRIEGDGFAVKMASAARMPGQLKAFVAAIPQSAWTTRPKPGAFSLVEHVCHLRDIDHGGYRERIERILTLDLPALHDLDGDALAVAGDYQRQDLAAACAAFVDGRGRILERLRGLSTTDRMRKGHMDGVGDMTIDDVVDAMVTHDSEHIDDIAALRDTLQR